MAIASAAPAVAASTCTNVAEAVPTWNSGTPNSFTMGGVTTTFTVTAASGTTTSSYNNTIGNTTQSTTDYNAVSTNTCKTAGLGNSNIAPGLILEQHGTSTTAASQTVTITFSKPVYGFKMRIRDLSWYSASDKDNVYFDVAPATITDSLGNTNGTTATNGGLSGLGTSASPLMRSTAYGSFPTGAGSGTTAGSCPTTGFYYDAELAWSSSTALCSLTMTYTNGAKSTTWQNIILRRFG